MALIDQVRVRLSTQKIAELTNPDVPSAKTENATRLGAACTDAKQLFQRFTGITFDDTNGGPLIDGVRSTDHWTIGVYGVVAVLYDYMGKPGSEVAERAMNKFKELCRAYKATYDGGMAWISPATNSNLVPSVEPAVRPSFDTANLGDLLPRDPRTSRDRLATNE